LADEIQREKMLLLMVLAVMLVLVVFLLRRSVQAHGSRAENVFMLLSIIMLALVAICVYQYIQSISHKGLF
jgi:hypothetical protein